MNPIVLMPEGVEDFVIAPTDTIYSKSEKHSVKLLGSSTLKVLHPRDNKPS